MKIRYDEENTFYKLRISKKGDPREGSLMAVKGYSERYRSPRGE
jgi:hypothetical protein